MKATEDCINHNAVRLIEEITSTSFDCAEEENAVVHYALALGEITGILDMARAMKEVLKV